MGLLFFPAVQNIQQITFAPVLVDDGQCFRLDLDGI